MTPHPIPVAQGLRPRSPRTRTARARGVLRLAALLPLLLANAASGCTAQSSSAAAVREPAAIAAPTAFVGVNVLPMDSERTLRDQTVIIRDGRVAEIGPAASMQVPAGAQRINADGKFLIPGFAEMHAHIPPPQANEQFGATYVEDILFLYLANGVTTLRGMLGHPSHLVLRERAAKGEIWSPRIRTSGPSLNGQSVASPEAAVRMVAEQKAAGYDLVKLHPGLTRAEFDSIDAAADRAGLPYGGHVSEDVGLRRALEAGQSSVDHLDGYVDALLPYPPAPGTAGFFGLALIDRAERSRLPALARATRDAGVWNVPTQSLIEHLTGPEPAEALAQRPEMRYMPPATVKQWVAAKQQILGSPGFTPAAGRNFIQLRRDIIGALHAAGAGLLLGSDAPQVFNVPGFAIHHELPMMVASGLSPFEALVAGTRSPAEYFGEAADWGTVQPGRRADLVLLDANPLQNVANASRIAGVMMGGRWLDAGQIRGRLDAIAARMAAAGG